MPTRKISDLPRPCGDPDHDPPTHIVLENGIYEHECPKCGQVGRFEVSRPTMVNGWYRQRAAEVMAMKRAYDSRRLTAKASAHFDGPRTGWLP